MLKLKTYSRKDKPASTAWYNLIEQSPNKNERARLFSNLEGTPRIKDTWRSNITDSDAGLFYSPLNVINNQKQKSNWRNLCLSKEKKIVKKLRKKRRICKKVEKELVNQCSHIEDDFKAIELYQLKVEKIFNSTDLFLQINESSVFGKSLGKIHNTRNSIIEEKPVTLLCSKECSKINNRESMNKLAVAQCSFNYRESSSNNFDQSADLFSALHSSPEHWNSSCSMQLKYKKTPNSFLELKELGCLNMLSEVSDQRHSVHEKKLNKSIASKELCLLSKRENVDEVLTDSLNYVECPSNRSDKNADLYTSLHYTKSLIKSPYEVHLTSISEDLQRLKQCSQSYDPLPSLDLQCLNTSSIQFSFLQGANGQKPIECECISCYSTDRILKKHKCSTPLHNEKYLINVNIPLSSLKEKSDVKNKKNSSPTRNRYSSYCSDLEHLAKELNIDSYTCVDENFPKVSSILDEKATTSIFDLYFDENISAKNKILRMCDQTEIMKFTEVYDWKNVEICQKIAEGSYGHVFIIKLPKKTRMVIKVIPIEGVTANVEQRKFIDLLSEILISKCLSDLQHNKYNSTQNFMKLNSVKCVHGSIPKELSKPWAKFDKEHGEYGGSPDSFSSNQVYIILETTPAGKELDEFKIKNVSEAKSIFRQIATSLAVAEKELCFEHRDLHSGNILLSRTRQKLIKYMLHGKELNFPSSGVFVTIIDFTLSRLSTQKGVVYYDLSSDPDLFTGEGDYQFSIYRLMKQKIDSWTAYIPQTNVMWLHYVIKKLLTSVEFNSVKKNTTILQFLRDLDKKILNFSSVSELISEL